MSNQTICGIPKLDRLLVPVPFYRCPRLLIPYKPDWHAAEVIAPRDVDYYISNRALGKLYRAVDLKPPPSATVYNSDQDNITTCLQPKVEPLIPTGVDTISVVEDVFDAYQEELGYISTTHVVTNVPGARLTEEEIVTGTISAK